MKIIYTAFEKSKFQFRIPALPTKEKKVVFSLCLGPDFAPMLRYRLLGYESVFLMMDAWPKYHERIERALYHFDVKTAFFSARQVVSVFESRLPQLRFGWIPEAVAPEKYLSKQSRDIDVLSFGRKWDLHHNRIVTPLEAKGVKYIFEKVKGQLIFPNRTEFVDALSRSKIAICVPSNITHPDRAGSIETLTWRYLQCMSSGCIILGMAPQELVDLFGYNPVLTIDMDNPVSQIMSILQCPDSYRQLVERNREQVLLKHQWLNRWAKIYEEIAIGHT